VVQAPVIAGAGEQQGGDLVLEPPHRPEHVDVEHPPISVGRRLGQRGEQPAVEKHD
jgi:hypothetical protein